VHLSAIKLRGFKSFPDPVEVRLEPGVAVVVGPNGSGKSNVGDGIVWAAGSLSPRELRAEKPDDVLFAGGAGRGPADFCEVELVFDNAAGDGPVEYSELSVSRRLHRGGEGQYLLNRTAVRRTDLVELLADLGLGGGMHSIIGQGRVEEILASSPERRRELLEEAAGLGRFKRRRHRAELKLARVGVQVERARDLEDEVRKRLRPLALQATAAERAERLRGEVAGLRARVAELDLAACRVRTEEWDERRSAVTLARRRADERLGAVLAERGRAEEELADAAGGRESATASLYRLRSAGERVGLRQEAAAALVEDVGAALAESASAAPGPDLAPLEREAAEAVGERDRAAAAVGAAQARLDELARTKRAALEVATAEAAREREAAGDALQRYRGASERVAVRRESAQELLAGLRAELQVAKRLGGVDVAALEREAEEASTAARAAHVEHERLAAAAEAARERLTALARSLVEREGLPPAARALAEEGERLALAGLHVDSGAERAVAAALGWRAAAVVAQDPAHGLELLERARRAGLGALAVVLRNRAEEVVRRTAVVPAEQLLDASGPAVTPEGHGYDPERGELWFAGETAEAVLLELESRRRGLEAEVERLAAKAEQARAQAEQTAARALAAEEAFAPYAHLAGRTRTDTESLHRLVRLAERLGCALADLPAIGERLASRAEDARRRGEELAARIGSLDREGPLTEARVEVEAAVRAAEEAAARAHAAESALRAAAPARRIDPVRLRRVLTAAERLGAALADAAAVCDRLETPLRARVDAGAIRTGDLAAELRRLAGDEAELRRAAAEAGERAATLDVERARLDAEVEDARRRLDEAGAEPAEGEDRDALAERAERLERKRIELGQVNPLAKEEYEREKERLAELSAQRADLEASLAELEKLRAELTETVERRFSETFAAVRTHFEEVAATLFPGGEGRLLLVDTDTEGESAGGASRFPRTPSTGPPARTGGSAAGVEVELRPAGKRITRLSLLSGGEKALGAISFLFALFLARPCPFYLLDEVEAALDDTNIGRFVELLRRYADRAQFVVVTHQKRTMEAADVLYGVTMGADGVSQIVSRRLPQEDRAALATA
jgi:chromosome segregation protein